MRQRLNKLKALAVAFALCAQGCASVEVPDVEYLEPMAVNKKSAEIDSSELFVVGWLSLEPEAKCLLQRKFSADESVPLDQGITILIPKSMERRAEQLNGKKVLVRGIFRKDILGDDVLFIGACNRTAISATSIQATR